MEQAESIMWGIATLCALIWVVGWAAFEAGLWIHTFIGAALLLAIISTLSGIRNRSGR